MKKLSLIFLLFTIKVFAGGDSVGNGGVLWACRSGQGGSQFHRGFLADLYEAQFQFHRTLIASDSADPNKIYESRKEWLKINLPELAEALQPRFDYVEKHRVFVQAELLSTQDFTPAIKPEARTCPEGEWKPQNIANFREMDQLILISNELWNSPNLSSLDKSALLFHEAIYYWMRSYYGVTNSDRARKITGILFSTMTPEEMKKEITSTLGSYPSHPDDRFMCVMKNSGNRAFVAYDNILEEASLSVRIRCQEDQESKSCQPTTLECDEIIEKNPAFKCVAENTVRHKIYTGLGRNQLEAQFQAHVSCYVGSLANHSSPQECPDFNFMSCRSLR